MADIDMREDARGGSAVPNLGTVLGAVGAAVLDLAPELGQWTFGTQAGSTIDAVKSALQTVTGSDDPNAQLAALADPTKAATLRVELARIAAERAAAVGESAQAALHARLADSADARAAATRPAQAETAIALGAPLVSVVVLATFGGVIAMAFTRPMPTGAEPVLNVLLGTLGAMATSVVSYWVGSSAGSARKDARLANLVDR